jgi:electron transfer flavoprotein alpha subunit
MSGPAKRLNPRRPFQITPQGLKRIILGQAGDAGAAVHVTAHHETAPKPLRLIRDPASYLLAIAHSDRGALDAHAHQAIAAAALLADPATAVVVLVLGDLSEDLAPFGADRIVVVPDCGNGVFNPGAELTVLADLVARFAPRHILMPDNAIGDGDLGRRLTAKLGAEAAAHVAEIKPEGVAAYWRGGAEMARRDLPKIILLDPETTDTALPFRGAGERIGYVTPEGQDSAYADLGLLSIEASQLALEEADFIVSAGNGVSSVPTLEAVAKVFGAAVGASRVAVDDGKFPRDKQIGATGKTANANVYMAVGISGAVQHLQGIRACRHVIAINMDASAPIARRADLTIVGDAQPVMEQLLEAARGRNWMGADAGAPKA